jgi:acyl carrier protein
VSDVRQEVIALLRETLRGEPDADGINSCQSVTLVAVLEERYGVTVPDDALDLENFRTVDGIVALVESLLAEPPQS